MRQTTGKKHIPKCVAYNTALATRLQMKHVARVAVATVSQCSCSVAAVSAEYRPVV